MVSPYTPRSGTRAGTRYKKSSPSPKRIRLTPGIDRAGVGNYNRYLPSSTEKKYIDTTLTLSDPVPTTGSIYDSLVNIAQGAGESQRVGRKVTVTAISLRYEVAIDNTSTPSATEDGVRVILFHDAQTNGVAASVTDILAAASYLSFNNLSNKERFKILSDKFHDVSCTAGAWDGANDQFAAKGVTKSVYLRCEVPVEFSGATGAITEIRSNNLGVLIISTKAKAKFSGLVRVRYADN